MIREIFSEDDQNCVDIFLYETLIGNQPHAKNVYLSHKNFIKQYIHKNKNGDIYYAIIIKFFSEEIIYFFDPQLKSVMNVMRNVSEKYNDTLNMIIRDNALDIMVYYSSHKALANCLLDEYFFDDKNENDIDIYRAYSNRMANHVNIYKKGKIVLSLWYYKNFGDIYHSTFATLFFKIPETYLIKKKLKDIIVTDKEIPLFEGVFEKDIFTRLKTEDRIDVQLDYFY